MSSISLTKVLTQRKANTPEIERENFERAQSVSLAKAINTQETPVKEKHVRSAIIGSFQEKGSRTFWACVMRLNLQGNPIVCWKFCHVLYKVLREGHPNSFEDSYANRKFLNELQKLWGLLRDGYGKLIGAYCKLLVAKLDFHRRNPKFPGNLQVTDEQLEEIGERDVNVYFQLSCEMFDYMDEILALQSAVFGSLDMSRSNSMTSSGQCRLAPLIPCIQDSSHLYDFTVKLLFKLHSILPPDTLVGHRDRFQKQYSLLQQFYFSSSNLQYFKYLIQVPLLPEYPPNFLISSNLESHISPVVILCDPPSNEATETDSFDGNLVDVTSTSSPVHFDDSFGEGDSEVSSSVPTAVQLLSDQLLEKDRIIRQLLKELEEVKLELQRLKIEYERKIDDSKRLRAAQEAKLAEYEREIEKLKGDIEELTKEKEIATSVQDSEKLAEKVKAQEEKFSKMKDIYGKLREEHIVLIRTKAEADKHLASTKASFEEVKQEQEILKTKLREAEREAATVKDHLQTSSHDREEHLSNLMHEKEMLESRNKELAEEMKGLTTKRGEIEEELLSVRRKLLELEEKNRLTAENAESNLKQIRLEKEQSRWRALLDSCRFAKIMVEGGMSEFDNPAIATLNCTPEYLSSHVDHGSKAFFSLTHSYLAYLADPEKVESLTNEVTPFAHHTAMILLHGKTTSQASPNIEQGDELALSCKNFGNHVLNLLDQIKNKNDPNSALDKIKGDLILISELSAKLVPDMSSDVSKLLVDLVQEELTEMDLAIEKAAKRIADMLEKSREADSGVKLEVNEKILDACTTLMQAIKELVQKARDLQAEIAARGRGSASIQEFYSRNHRWTEGLISAAKVVGLSARFLVDAADKVVLGNAKYEELVVASQEIAAATAQLVVASKVKAERGSDCLGRLSKASRRVTELTGNVVATAKSCSKMVEDKEILDFSKLSLHQAKLLEMESQVRVLELESSLEKERMKLAELRKKHYHMAGASEGWDQPLESNGQ